MTGERIEALLAEIRATVDPSTLGRVEELVEQLVGLYGAGLARVLALLAETGAMSGSLERSLADDPLVSALLTLHDLHPHDTAARVEAALERVRPQLGAHAGGVHLVGIDERRIARVRLEGSCDGCSSATATLRQLVERAIEDAAPEIAGVEVESPTAPSHPPPLVSIGRRTP